MMRTSNPALNDKMFKSGSMAATGGDVMTLDGTINRTIFSVLLTMAAAFWSWNQPQLGSMYIPFIIGALIVAVIICFKPTLAPVLTPVYAVFEGFVLGTLSLFAETFYPGIVFQALGLTLGTLFCMLMLYKSGAIKVTEKFRMGVMAATAGIFVMYLISFVIGMFGGNVSFLHDSSLLSIGISLFVVGIAALNLVLDFDLIERAASSGRSPKYMEWYGAFALLVTLVWLYIELLRLLMKLKSRD